MKYSIIIADDERRMAELIKQLGHWDELNIEIVDVCYNGISALESISQNKPNIVLTDIKMPGYDGIELIRKVKELGLDVSFIIVSGYRHFEYAKSAMQYGVIDYLLKPIDEIQLNETLKKACQKFDEEQKNKDEKEEIRFFKQLAFDQQGNSLWGRIMSDTQSLTFQQSGPEDDLLIDSFNENLKTRFTKCYFEALCIRTNMDGILTKTSLLQEKVKDIISRISNEELYIESRFSIGGVFVILNFNKETTEKAKQSISALFYGIKNLTEIYGPFSITIGCSSISANIGELSKLIREAQAAQNGRLIYGSDKILNYSMINNLPRFSTKDLISKEDEDKIIDCYDFLKFDELKNIQTKIIDLTKKYKSSNPLDMLDFQIYIIDLALSRFITEEKKKKQVLREIIISTGAFDSFEKLIEHTFGMLLQNFEEYVNEQKEKRQQPVQKAIKYIEQNYNQSISQETVAEAVGLSSAYFSKLFKAESGLGFAEYLTKIRLDKSKKMLAETTKSIKSIALEIGYSDDKYFSKLFKKVIGLKPTDYRRLYS